MAQRILIHTENMHSHVGKLAITAIALAAALALFGCGGGSSGSPPPPPLPAGTLDPTFGTSGLVVTPIGLNAQATAVALQADGKSVAAGYVDDGARRRFALVRYNADGSLDAGFGAAGIVVTPIGAADAEIRSLVVQPDGKIVAAGYAGVRASIENHVCALARYNGDGTLDPGFGTGGVVEDDLGPSGYECSSIALQTDGKIVAVPRRLSDPWLMMIIRLAPDGRRDPAFGANGMATGPWTYTHEPAVAIQPDGGIVVVASSRFLIHGLNSVVSVARFNSLAAIDPTFGDGGLVSGADLEYSKLPRTEGLSTEFDGSVSLQPDGKIVVVAFGAILRYLPAGALDPAFGSNGIAIAPTTDALHAALQFNGSIVVTGGPGFRLARFTSEGLPDKAFGANGEILTTIGKADSARALAIQSDGRIVVTGTSTSTTMGPASTPVDRDSFVIARYVGDPVAPGAP